VFHTNYKTLIGELITFLNNFVYYNNILYIADMKLTDEQLEIVENESYMYKAFDPNFEYISKGLWNKYRISAKVYYKDGELHKVEEY